MPPKGKGAGAKAAKEEAANAKDAAARAAKEKAEAAEWSKGAKGKGKGDDKAEKAAEAAAKKAERERMLAEEEASLPSKPKAAPKAAAKKPPPAKKEAPKEVPSFEAIEEYSASNLDDALDALSLVTERTDKAFVGAKASKIEAHPERRFKAAFEAYKEAELPNLRKERPGMRLQQYHEVLFKQFEKHPDNPFNAQHVAYNATKDEKVAALKSVRDETEKRLRAEDK